MEGARLAAHDIACRRGDRLLFAGLSFELAAGDALQVTGANGTGKSSLIRILAGLLRPFSGSVERGGDIALLDGNLPLDAHLPLGTALGFWEKIDRPRVSAVDDGLAALADVPVRFLSTGQRKRAAVLQSNPAANAIWLLDEPLNGLDIDAVGALQARIARHCAGGGIAVVASHQPLAIANLRQIALADYAA